MAQIRIRHEVSDYDTWKHMFDSDPLDRKGSGVRSYRVSRGAAEAGVVLIDLDFDTVEEASAMQARLLAFWSSPDAPPLLKAEAIVVETMESAEI